MEIVVEKPFGPFENIGGVDLPEFSVFIGLNGSGKTQLLLALKNGHVVARIDGRPVARHNILYIGNQLNAGVDLEYSLGDAQALENRLKARLALHKAGTAEIPGHLGHQARSDLDERLEEIAALLGKELTVLLDEEAEALAFAVAPQKASPYPFSLGIAYVSMGYLRTRYHRARLEHFATAERDPSFDAVIAILRGQENRPPPWETASEALMAFGFRIEGPRQTYAAGQQDLKLVLRNELGREVPVNHLSSGERAMLAIAVAQYIGDSWDSTRAIIA